jgi:hypothetical protein
VALVAGSDVGSDEEVACVVSVEFVVSLEEASVCPVALEPEGEPPS